MRSANELATAMMTMRVVAMEGKLKHQARRVEKRKRKVLSTRIGKGRDFEGPRSKRLLSMPTWKIFVEAEVRKGREGGVSSNLELDAGSSLVRAKEQPRDPSPTTVPAHTARSSLLTSRYT